MDILAETDSEKYLGRKLALDHTHEVELNNRLAGAWAPFHKNKAELCSKSYCLADRLRLFEAVITPVALYACSAWGLKKSMEKKLRTAWRRILRYVFRIHRLNLPDSGPEPWIEFVQRSAHKVDELAAKHNLESWVQTYHRRKWRFAGRLARIEDGRWSRKILDWQPESSRSRQRPLTRWSDQLTQYAGGNWMEIAIDTVHWSALEEGFVLNL